MSTTKARHYPAPWTVGPELRSGRFGGPTIKAGGLTIAVAMTGSGHRNAPVLAAAPELLEACRPAVEWGEKFNAPDDPTVVIELTREEFDALRAAVAKASE